MSRSLDFPTGAINTFSENSQFPRNPICQKLVVWGRYNDQKRCTKWFVDELVQHRNDLEMVRGEIRIQLDPEKSHGYFVTEWPAQPSVEVYRGQTSYGYHVQQAEWCARQVVLLHHQLHWNLTKILLLTIRVVISSVQCLTVRLLEELRGTILISFNFRIRLSFWFIVI